MARWAALNNSNPRNHVSLTMPLRNGARANEGVFSESDLAFNVGVTGTTKAARKDDEY